MGDEKLHVQYVLIVKMVVTFILIFNKIDYFLRSGLFFLSEGYPVLL